MVQAAADLSLPMLPIQTDDFAADPFPYLKQARSEHPWLAKTDAGFYLIHEYDAIKELSLLDDKMRPAMDGITEFMGGQGGPWAEHFSNTMLAKQPPDHTRIRAAVAPSFTPANINRFRPLMRQAVSDLLDEWEQKGSFDFAQFAACFPIRIMFALIGASPSHLPGILEALETQGMSANLVRELLPALNKAVEDLWAFVHMIIVERQKNGGGEPNDVLNSLIAAHTPPAN
jgi:cytochrome P450